MPRKHTLRTPKFPYHVINRSNQRTWYKADLVKVWQIALESLSIALEHHPVNIHAFVLMSNHYHLVIDTPNSDIDKFMYYFNKNFSLKIRIETRLINRMFGGRYKWSIIKEQDHYLQVLKYVLLNPIKANICSRISDYRFSTIYYQLQDIKLPFQIKAYQKLTCPSFLEWIHIEHTKEQQESITKGLIKTEFSYAGSRQKRTPPSFAPQG